MQQSAGSIVIAIQCHKFIQRRMDQHALFSCHCAHAPAPHSTVLTRVLLKLVLGSSGSKLLFQRFLHLLLLSQVSAELSLSKHGRRPHYCRSGLHCIRPWCAWPLGHWVIIVPHCLMGCPCMAAMSTQNQTLSRRERLAGQLDISRCAP